MARLDDAAWLVGSYTGQFLISWLDLEWDANDTSCHKQIRISDPNVQSIYKTYHVTGRTCAAFGRLALYITL